MTMGKPLRFAASCLFLTTLILPLTGAGSFPPVATFSIVAYDESTGELGVAVASRFLAVGSVVPWAKAGVGAIATQARANTRYGPEGLRLLSEGRSPAEAIKMLTEEDPDRDVRQVGIINAKGEASAFTGDKTLPYAGHRIGRQYAVQGNILAGPQVLSAMGKAFEKSQGLLAERMLSALEAGERVGGDRRGKQSAALLVVREGGGYAGLNDRFMDLRVDDHPDPVKELRRLLGLQLELLLRPPR